LRKILFSAVLLLALLLAFEVGVTFLSERGFQKALKSQYGMPDSLKVSINSFPLTLSLIRNHLGQLRMTWEGQVNTITPSGQEENPTYFGQINLYDVELNMPALLRTRLEIRQISRIKAAIILTEESLNLALGIQNDDIIVADGEIFKANTNPKVQYKLKVLNGDTLSLEPLSGSIGDSDYLQNPQPALQASSATATFGTLPLDGRLQRASIEGDKAVIDMAIPIWEGYIEI